jgi:mono/diheme cytochrome c family protein
LAVGLGFAERGTSQSKTLVIAANKTSAMDGKQMFSNYCAPCHGADGKGRGLVAQSLNASPSDLTALTKNNNGRFPASRVTSVLNLGPAVHGSRVMPAWGPILGGMNLLETNRSYLEEKCLRISSLNRYLESMQQR